MAVVRVPKAPKDPLVLPVRQVLLKAVRELRVLEAQLVFKVHKVCKELPDQQARPDHAELPVWEESKEAQD